MTSKVFHKVNPIYAYLKRFASKYVFFFVISSIVFGMSLFKLLAIVMAPFALLKSLISCLHAYVASIDLVALDMREREAKREKEEGKKAE